MIFPGKVLKARGSLRAELIIEYLVWIIVMELLLAEFDSLGLYYVVMYWRWCCESVDYCLSVVSVVWLVLGIMDAFSGSVVIPYCRLSLVGSGR